MPSLPRLPTLIPTPPRAEDRHVTHDLTQSKSIRTDTTEVNNRTKQRRRMDPASSLSAIRKRAPTNIHNTLVLHFFQNQPRKTSLCSRHLASRAGVYIFCKERANGMSNNFPGGPILYPCLRRFVADSK